MKKTSRAVLAICAVAALGAADANASCPVDMPQQLLQDCIVVEGSGVTFPNETYANMLQYQEWKAGRSARNEPATHSATKGGILTKNISN